MERLIYAVPLFLLLTGCAKKTENNPGDGTPIDNYRQGIDRAQEVQQKSTEWVKNIDSISQGN